MTKAIITGILFLMSVSLNAQILSSGALNGNTFRNDATVGSIDWNVPVNAKSSDNIRSNANALVLGDISNYLIVEDFGLTIPANASICGIEVEIEKSALGILSTIKDNEIKLVSGGTVMGANRKLNTNWNNNDSYETYGGNNDMWELSLTPGDVNSSNFGVAISVSLNAVSVLPVARVDHLRIIIYYTQPLPVSLFEFKGKADQNIVSLWWATASETNNDHFVIEHSNDGKNWEALAKIKGNGTSNEFNKYEWSGKLTEYGDIFFRLKQTDYNGTETFSDIISLVITRNNNREQIRISPHPVRDLSLFELTEFYSPNLSLTIFSANGKIIKEQTISNNSFYINRQDFDKGIYYYKIHAEDGQEKTGQICFAD